MSKLLFFIILLLSIYSFYSEEMEGAVPDPDVIILNSSNFDEIVNPYEVIAVEFYAPWCGHCKHLQPEWAKAATALKPFNIPLAKVDATKNGGLATRYQVNGYPTIILFRNGKRSDYKGPRETDGIVKYMKKQVGPSSKELNTISEVETFTKDVEDNFAVVGFFSSTNSPLYSSFVLNSNSLRDNYRFGKVVNNPEINAYFKVADESIVAFKQYDDFFKLYDGDSKTKNLETFIVDNSCPIVGNYTSETRAKYEERGLPILKFFAKVDWKNNLKQMNYYLNRVRPTALALRDKVTTVFVNVDEGKLEGELKELGVDKATAPTLVMHDFKNRQKYHFEETLKASAVTKFVNDFLEGALPKYVKSEKPMPDDGFVKVANGRNFETLVNDPEKDVLIELYAPWCGHCKALEPKYKELAEKAKKFKNVVIAKMDATANDYPSSEFPVKGYPTIFIVPGTPGAKPILYEGEREVDSMLTFIKANAARPLKSKKKKSQITEEKPDL